MVRLRSNQLHLIAAPPPKHVGQHFAIRAAELEASVADPRARELDVSAPLVVGAGRQSFLRDPDGNPIELHEIGG
jgi:hypothetical protein